jgi:hypothetical protein
VVTVFDSSVALALVSVMVWTRLPSPLTTVTLVSVMS